MLIRSQMAGDATQQPRIDGEFPGRLRAIADESRRMAHEVFHTADNWLSVDAIHTALMLLRGIGVVQDRVFSPIHRW